MKVYNPVSSGKASGRALGGVFSFNRGLPTFKKYVKSYYPNTAAQEIIKSRFSYLTKFWKTQLTYDEITLWNNWNLPWTDIYGAVVLLTGINKFVICNSILLEAEKTITRIPPTLTPSNLDISENARPESIEISIDGLTDAEVNAQESFLQIQIPGTPTKTEYIDGQLDIFWDGMPRGQRPLEKNWKTIFFYDSRTGYEGEVELRIMITPVTSIVGLQPIRIQRFNKFGYWSGKETYINPLSKFNFVLNGNFFTDTVWGKAGAVSIADGRGKFSGAGGFSQTIPLTIGTTYHLQWRTKFIDPVGTIRVIWQGNNMFPKTTSGWWAHSYQIQDLPDMSLQFEGLAPTDAWIDNVIVALAV